MFEAIISGIGHTPFRAHEDSLETLLTSAVREALDDASTPASEIDEVFIGHFGAGMDPQGFVSSLVLNADPAFHLKPVHRLENACASGSAAVHAAVRAVMSGQSRCVLVAGVEKMSACGHVGQALATASYQAEESQFDSFAALFGEIANRYFNRFGNHETAMAQIAAKNHQNGLDNPLAQLRKDLSVDFCAAVSGRNPRVAGPLKRTDCSPVSDGAAALVISRPENVHTPSNAVRFRAIAQVNDYLPISKTRPFRTSRLSRGLEPGLPASATVRCLRSGLRGDPRLFHHRRAHAIRGHGAYRTGTGLQGSAGGLGHGGRAPTGQPLRRP